MSLQCGIVGLPNVGKSTLFNALTKAGIAAENSPFCTIEPNVGIVEVPDPRLAQLAAIVKPQRVQLAIVEFVDIAGLHVGPRPPFGVDGYWLYLDGRAVLHLIRSGTPARPGRPTPRIDHCAFRVEDPQAWHALIDRLRDEEGV